LSQKERSLIMLWWNELWLGGCVYDREAEIYRLRHDEHMSMVRRLRSSIEAHVRLLAKVGLCVIIYKQLYYLIYKQLYYLISCIYHLYLIS